MATASAPIGESREDRIFNAVIYGCLALVFVSATISTPPDCRS